MKRHSFSVNPRAIALFGLFVVCVAGLARSASRERKTQQQAPPASVSALAWMAGYWTTQVSGTTVEEIWWPPHGDVMVGMSRTTDSERTRSFEFMRIVSRADGIFFVAQPGGRPGVDFKLASLSGDEVTFVNPGHSDHLKKIMYRKNADGTLFARIEGADAGKSFSEEWTYSHSRLTDSK